MDSSMPPIQSCPEGTPIVITKSKKRKTEEVDNEMESMKSKARFYCKDVAEWRKISKYSKSKLHDYLNDQGFFDSVSLMQHFGQTGIDIYAMLLDKILKGEGFVEQEIKSDLSLKQAIQREMIQYIAFVTNKMQILLFTTIDCMNGKKKQLKQDVSSTHSVSITEQPNTSHKFVDAGTEPCADQSFKQSFGCGDESAHTDSRNNWGDESEEDREEENF